MIQVHTFCNLRSSDFSPVLAELLLYPWSFVSAIFSPFPDFPFLDFLHFQCWFNFLGGFFLVGKSSTFQIFFFGAFESWLFFRKTLAFSTNGSNFQTIAYFLFAKIQSCDMLPSSFRSPHPLHPVSVTEHLFLQRGWVMGQKFTFPQSDLYFHKYRGGKTQS